VTENEIVQLGFIEVEFEPAVYVRPAILFRSNSCHRQSVDYHCRDVIEPKILQQQRSAQMIKKTRQIAFPPVRIDPQTAGISHAPAQRHSRRAIDRPETSAHVVLGAIVKEALGENFIEK